MERGKPNWTVRSDTAPRHIWTYTWGRILKEDMPVALKMVIMPLWGARRKTEARLVLLLG